MLVGFLITSTWFCFLRIMRRNSTGSLRSWFLSERLAIPKKNPTPARGIGPQECLAQAVPAAQVQAPRRGTSGRPPHPSPERWPCCGLLEDGLEVELLLHIRLQGLLHRAPRRHSDASQNKLGLSHRTLVEYAPQPQGIM